MTYVAKVTWASVGQHFTPEWMKPGIIFACCLVTYRIVSTQLLSLGNLKIRCNCSDKSGDYTTPCPSKSCSQSVYLCALLSWKILHYLSVRDTYQSNLTSAFEVGGEQHRPSPMLEPATKLHFTHKHICSSAVFWLLKKKISLDRHHQQVSPLCGVSSQPSHIVKMTQTKLLNLGHWYSMCYAGVHTSNALNSKFLN